MLASRWLDSAPVLVVAGAIMAASLAMASTASADGRICTMSAGCVSFKSSGNRFDVCDYAKDGLSVVAQYVTETIDGHRNLVNYWGSEKYNGCREFTVSGKAGAYLAYQVCLADNATPGGKPMKILGDTCSTAVRDHF